MCASPRTVLSVHNFYREGGGEDAVFASEAALLERKGHQVVRFEKHNRRIQIGNIVSTAVDTLWSSASYTGLQSLIGAHQPEIAHFHNTFPLISPAAVYAAHRRGLPVVQTLHNYRLLCLGGTFLRDGRPCEDCLDTSAWRGAVRGCYRNSHTGSLVVASMLELHRLRRTWIEVVDVLIALSEFSREKFIRGGLPADRVVVKPNFVDPDPGVGCGGGGYALFVGRLSEEKGIRTLIDAWERLSRIPLRIVGKGPLAEFRQVDNVSWLGAQTRDQVMAQMKAAEILIVPS